MYRLKELEIALSERGHVVKAAEISVLSQASAILAEAGRQGEEIIEAARQRYAEEEVRGYADGLARAAAEAIDRLAEEQATLDACLSGLTGELTQIVCDCMRQLVGTYDRQELARDFVTHAIRSMRRQKRIRLSVGPEQYEPMRAHVERVTQDFPEIEMIDVLENPALTDSRFVMEAESGRIEGSIEESLARIEEQLRAVLHHRPGNDAAPRIGTARKENGR